MQPDQTTAHRFDLLTPSIFFTPLFLFFIAVILFVALLYGQKELALFSFLILVGAAALKPWSRFSPRRLACRTSVDREKLFPGEKTSLRIHIENNKFLPVFIKIGWRIDHFLQADGQETVIEEECGLFWHQGVAFHRECIAQKRGCYQLGAPALAAGDFFGFFPRACDGSRDLEVLVYPRRIPIAPFPLLKRIMFGKPGAASPVRDPVYILGAREYQPFRPARYIHWKASARHGRLQEKIFEPAEQDKALLVLDAALFSQRDARDEFERAIEALAAVAAELESQNYAVGFITNADGRNRNGDFFLPVARRPGHLSALLEILARIELRSTEKMSTLLDRARGLPADAICVYFSHDPRAEKTYLNRRRTPTVNIVCGADSDDGSRSRESAGAGSVHYLKDICIPAKENDP